MTVDNVSAKDQGLQYDSVKAWDAGIGEMDRTRAVVFVPRAEVSGLELAYAPGAERPLIAILLAIFVLAVSVTPLLYLLAAISLHFKMDVKLFFIAGFAPLGLWLFRFALKKRLILIVSASKGQRKMVFQGASDLNAVRDFVARIGNRYGYLVTFSETLHGFGGTPRTAS